MARTHYIIAYTLIICNAAGEHINGTGSRGGLDYARKLARSCLHTDRTGRASSVDIYTYDPAVSWQQLQPLATVTLDDESEVER
jgi:hypothetical protein